VGALTAAAAAAGLGMGGAIAGALVGVMLIVAAGVITFYMLRRRARRRGKAVAQTSQRRREAELKDSASELKEALAAKEAEKVLLEAQLQRAQQTGGMREEDVAAALTAALAAHGGGGGAAPSQSMMAAFMASLSGAQPQAKAGSTKTALAPAAVDPLNSAGINPMAMRAASLRVLTKGGSAGAGSLAAQGALSGAAQQQQQQQQAASRAASGRTPSISDSNFSRAAIVSTNSGRAVAQPAAATPKAKAPVAAAHSAVWSPADNAYYFVDKRTQESTWEIADEAERELIREEARQAGLTPLPFDEPAAAAAATSSGDGSATNLPSGWSTAQDGEGNIYYVNDATGASSWELPT